ncbi:hypothetical protein SK128_009187, partial [Halocaridina rubra]
VIPYLVAPCKHLVYPLEKSREIFIIYDNIVNNLNTIFFNLKSHVITEATDSCKAHGSSTVFETYIWGDESNE